jgi:hypothetical protein
VDPKAKRICSVFMRVAFAGFRIASGEPEVVSNHPGFLTDFLTKYVRVVGLHA